MISGLVYLRRRSGREWETSVDRVLWELLAADCTEEALAAARQLADRGLVALIGPDSGASRANATESSLHSKPA
ncbi:MAG: hypothetical protein AB7J35_09395 [Dehalococcoidia bacterium]